MRQLLAVLTLSLSATAVAYANPAPPTQGGSTQGELQAIDNWVDQFGGQFEDWFYATWGPTLGITDPDSGNGGTGGGTVAAPEFDPAGAIAALTLLAGGLAVLRGRRSRKPPQ